MSCVAGRVVYIARRAHRSRLITYVVVLTEACVDACRLTSSCHCTSFRCFNACLSVSACRGSVL